MAEEIKDTEKNLKGLTRRDFLKVSAAATAAGGLTSVVDWVATAPNPALADDKPAYDTITTCPYCSVGCNMLVGIATEGPNVGKVVDIIGDPECPINRGALCSKGSAAVQLVNNTRRLGVAGSIHAASAAPNEGPMKRTGDNAWEPITWANAMSEIATAMVGAREAASGWTDASGRVTSTARGVAFLGCSHATNEENWLYRKLIANFGTNNTEHQARI